MKHYSLNGDQLLRKGKLVVANDPAMRQTLLQFFHSNAVGGHSGIHSTYYKLSTVLYWKGM